jgi:hypothetical protein|tara:strand:- start:455 stop:601 length:147 start_codon:yes stop_codon:yes gene_type:complete
LWSLVVAAEVQMMQLVVVAVPVAIEQELLQFLDHPRQLFKLEVVEWVV